VASLFVIQGADQGKRFELADGAAGLGRDATNAIRLHDHEVSRRHAEVRRDGDGDGYRVVDVGSANGTYLNGQAIEQAALKPGDQVRLGQTVMLFDATPPSVRELTDRVDLLGLASPGDRSAILRSIPADEGSRVLEAPGSAGEWLKERLASLAVMYRAAQAISSVVEIDALLPQVLQLVFDSIGADRGAILLRDEAGELVPKAVRWRGPADPDERLTISRTIVDHVLIKGQGVITSDAPADSRFGPAQSIVDYGIREAMCVPVQGRHATLGVLYVDALAPLDATAPGGMRHRFSNDHLKLMVALGHQAGLAIENTELYQAKVQAERLAAVGQTIATLSHHIKNILQGLRGGGYLVEMGLDGKDEPTIRKGWAIVEKNQTKIYNLVMDMLSFSKEREPALDPADLNATVADVVELMRSRAEELNVGLEWSPAAGMPDILLDAEGIHRAVLNIITNAIDAAESAQGGRVAVSTSWDDEFAVARVAVADNGVGIPEAEIESIFRVFASTKGSRGTGLGLSVSQKIIREHGGKIAVVSAPGKGSTFTIELPLKRPEAREGDAFQTMT
jgi:signal transduction histidine kinase/pSer/pThr/pTyr-binding forkhead associated (FHA) protein